METDDIFAAVAKIQSKSRKSERDKFIEETVKYEKKVYDLEQLVEIGLAFSSTLNFDNLIESINHRLLFFFQYSNYFIKFIYSTRRLFYVSNS